MSVTSVRIFGTDRDAVHQFAEDGRTLCENKGVEFTGPYGFAVVHCGHVIEHFGLDQPLRHSYEEIPDWFSRMEFSEREAEAIRSTVESDIEEQRKVIFGRGFQIYEDCAAGEIVGRDLPSNVFLRISVDVEEIPKPKGKVPYSYDPNIDHVTDLDFDAR